MRERLRQLGGSLEIESNGKGTIVEAWLPVAAPFDGRRLRPLDQSRIKNYKPLHPDAPKIRTKKTPASGTG